MFLNGGDALSGLGDAEGEHGKDRVVRMFTSERANAQAEEVLTRFID